MEQLFETIQNFTLREKEVFKLLNKNVTNAQIAKELDYSNSKIRIIIKSIHIKLGLETRKEIFELKKKYNL